ncbi:hypothetical protein RQP46_010672 [Phenoliferia psychrophenolica]
MHNDQLAKFKKLDWVREACIAACHVAFRIGTKKPLHTTHVVLIHYEFDHSQPLARQFRVTGAELLTHKEMAATYDTMSTPGLHGTLDWIEEMSKLIDDILPPPSYDWVAALRDKIALGGPPLERPGAFSKGRVQTGRDLREQRRVRERTDLHGDDLKLAMQLLTNCRDVLGWDGPDYPTSIGV